MTNLINLICAAGIGCAATALALPKHATEKTVTIEKRVEVPGPTIEVEKVIHEPLDTVRIGELEADVASLRAQLRSEQAAVAETNRQKWLADQLKKSEACANGSCGPAVSGQRFRLFGRRR